MGHGERGVPPGSAQSRTIVTSVLMLTLSILLLFNINDAGPNVNDVILPVGVFVRHVNTVSGLTFTSSSN